MVDLLPTEIIWRYKDMGSPIDKSTDNENYNININSYLSKIINPDYLNKLLVIMQSGESDFADIGRPFL